MKYFSIVLVLLLSGCASKYEYDPQPQAKKLDKVTDQIELAQTQKHGFCEGSKLMSYIETKRYYQWTCYDGRSFMLPK